MRELKYIPKCRMNEELFSSDRYCHIIRVSLYICPSAALEPLMVWGLCNNCNRVQTHPKHSLPHSKAAETNGWEGG